MKTKYCGLFLLQAIILVLLPLKKSEKEIKKLTVGSSSGSLSPSPSMLLQDGKPSKTGYQQGIDWLKWATMETTSVCFGGTVLKKRTTYSLSVLLLEDFGDLS